jgi:osmotically-inducible protein OsmY
MMRSFFFSRRFQKLIGTAILISCLSGCIPAALVIGATAGGAVIYDKRSMKTIAQDQEAGERAGRLINQSPELKGSHIAIATFDHVLLLVGQTPTEAQRDTAYQLVSNINNVSRVYNEITVQKPTSSWQRSHDAWITTKIKTEMLTSQGLHSTEIKVVTENGVVYLMGVLSDYQANLAVNIARRADGVQKVVKVFENPR